MHVTIKPATQLPNVTGRGSVINNHKQNNTTIIDKININVIFPPLYTHHT